MSSVRLVLDVARLHELFSLGPDGKLFRKVKAGSAKPGDLAGNLNAWGYLQVNVDGRPTYAHRVAFAMANGRWAMNEIDHINGDKSDNRPENLREVCPSINKQNLRKAQSNSKSGLLGASPTKWGKFVAQIKINGRQTFLGNFETAEEAHRCYLAAKRKYHEGCTL